MKILIAFVLGLLALPLLAAALAFTGHLGSDSRADPPGWEVRAGGGALDAALEGRAKEAGVSFAAPSDAELLLGMKEYREHCVGCHGGFRGQSDWGAHAFYPRVPQFWQQPVEITQSEAYVAIRDGIRYSGMAIKSLWEDGDAEQTYRYAWLTKLGAKDSLSDEFFLEDLSKKLSEAQRKDAIAWAEQTWARNFKGKLYDASDLEPCPFPR